MRHQENLFRYIYTVVPHEQDARDVLQETCIALYRKAAEYQPDKPFLTWARGFAQLEILKHRERTARKSILLSKELIELLAKERAQQEMGLQDRLTALERCLERLPEKDWKLIEERYQGPASIDEIARQSGSSRRTLFRSLERIRRFLFDCVSRRLAAEGKP